MSQIDHGRDQILKRLKAAIEQLNLDVAKVEIWASALVGFSQPVPDYHAGKFLLPAARGEGHETSKRRR